MNIPAFTSGDFASVAPAGVLVLGGILLLISEVFLSSPARTYQMLIALSSTVLAGALAFSHAFEPAALVLQGFAVSDPFSNFLTVLVCVATVLALLLTVGFLKHRNAERGEFYALMLFAAAGMSLLGLSNEFITLFINLEVLSISTYALTAYLRRGKRPAEAGFKYFILGAFSAVVMLYGASLLYGATGTTKFSELARTLGGADKKLVIVGFVLIASGFAFKVSAVPFHMWTPDVYEGAPTPVTALMSAGVKAAAFVALVRVLTVLGPQVDGNIGYHLFAALAAMTMLVGNLLAAQQRNVKRMLAYSSIAHAGYMLVGVAALFAEKAKDTASMITAVTPFVKTGSNLTNEVYQGILFYLLSYTVTSLGSFGVLAAVERREDETSSTTWDLDRLSGLASRKPGWALAMALFMLSLAGVPPTVGFMGKLLVFRAGVDAGLIGLSIFGVLTSAVGVFYYLRVVVHMYMKPTPSGLVPPERHWATDVALAASAVAVVALGVMPGTFADWFSRAGMVFGGR